MKLCKATSSAAFLAFTVTRSGQEGVSAFTHVGSGFIGSSTFKDKVRSRVLKLAAQSNDDIEELRARAAKAREEAAALAKELGRDEVATTKQSTSTVVEVEKIPEVDVMNSLSSQDLSWDSSSLSAAEQTSKLDGMVQSGSLNLWKSAVRSTPTNSEPLRTYAVSLGYLESRTNGLITAETLGVGGESDVSLDDFKDATITVTLASTAAAFASLAFLPQNIGATLCYLIALIPVVFIGIGSTAPGIIAGGIASLRGTGDDDDKKKSRICAHEAGHFLCGYLCGLPIRSYSTGDDGYPQVEFHPSADAPDDDSMYGRGNGREFTKEEIAALSVVAMSGSVAEVLQLGEAKGGENDLIELDGLFRRSEEFIGAQKQQDLTRWGALVAYELIQKNMNAYKKLISDFEAKKSVAECIATIESAL